MALLNDIVVFLYSDDWSCRRSTPAGVRGRGDTPQERSDEEAPGTPAESERMQRKSTAKFYRAK